MALNSTALDPVHIGGSNPASLPNNLNDFFTKFETDNSTQLVNTRSALQPGNSPYTFHTKDVVKTNMNIAQWEKYGCVLKL